MPNNILSLIADNPPLFEALKNLFIGEFTDQKYNLTSTNEHLGELTRARLQGLSCLDAAFRKIDQCKSINTNRNTGNPAR